MQNILQDIHICQLISSTSNEQVSFFTKHYFRVPPERGRGHFRGLHISMLKIILSFINSGHPSNQTSISSSPTRSSVSTAAQLGRSITTGGSQSNLCNAAVKTPWRSQLVAQNYLGKSQSQMWGEKNDKLMISWLALWLHQTPSLSMWLSEGDEKCAPSVLSPFSSSSALKTTS